MTESSPTEIFAAGKLKFQLFVPLKMQHNNVVKPVIEFWLTRSGQHIKLRLTQVLHSAPASNENITSFDTQMHYATVAPKLRVGPCT